MPLPLVTERLRLRPATIDDFEAWHAIARDAEEAWFGAASSTLADSQARLEKHAQHQESHGFALWVVELRSTGEVIGITGLTHLEDGPRSKSATASGRAHSHAVPAATCEDVPSASNTSPFLVVHTSRPLLSSGSDTF